MSIPGKCDDLCIKSIESIESIESIKSVKGEVRAASKGEP